MDACEAKRIARVANWRERVVACRNSGLSVREWCQQEGISSKTYYRYERMILDMVTFEQKGDPGRTYEALTAIAKDNPNMPSKVFARLPAPAESCVGNRQPAATVHIGSVSMDIYEGAGEETLRAILRVIDHAE